MPDPAPCAAPRIAAFLAEHLCWSAFWDKRAELPTAAGVMMDAPDRIKAALMAAFDIYALYNKDTDQVTIRASITEDTPRTIAALLADPRTDDDTGQARAPAPGTAPRLATVSHSRPGPIWRLFFRLARIFRGIPGLATHKGHRSTPCP
jgi:hypothetical protein